MRIKEYTIHRYGPLPDSGRVFLQDFNLIHGRNESGKTLTIEALLKLLFKRGLKEFDNIHRVEEDPDGFVVIENAEGEEIKLSSNRTFEQITGITPSLCRNIFIIRNSDLSISREDIFYAQVTERLTGLRTDEIDKIIKTLREEGKITESGMFRDVKDEKLRTRLEIAKNLIEEIDKNLENIKQEGIANVEEQIVLHKEELRSIQTQIERFNEARLRENYEKGRDALDNLITASDKLEKIEMYNDKDAQLWRDYEREIGIYREQKTRAEDELSITRNKLESIENEIKDREEQFQSLEEKKRFLDTEVRSDLRNVEEKVSLLPGIESKSKLFSTTALILAILFGVSVAGIIFSPQPFFYVLSGILFLLMVVSGIFYFITQRDNSAIRSDLKRLNLKISRYHWNAPDLHDIMEKIQLFEDEYQRVSNEYQTQKQQKMGLGEKIKDLTERTVPELEKKIASCQEEIDKLKNKSKEETIEGYIQKLKEKQEQESIVARFQEVLSRDFGRVDDNLEKSIERWRNELEKLEPYRDKAKGLHYSNERVQELKEREQALNNELNGLKELQERQGNLLRDTERKVKEVPLFGGEEFVCRSTSDLPDIKQLLKNFIDVYEQNKNDVLLAIDIFSTIKSEEKQKISELFGDKSPVAKYFGIVTNGLYDHIRFNQETGQIEVRHRSGKYLTPEKLSGGAYDQLYFAIRIALGEKLLKHQAGFFILDDPFIKSDTHRLQRQINLLKNISANGWQIVYFTTKDEVFNVLGEDINQKNVNYIALKNFQEGIPEGAGNRKQ